MGPRRFARHYATNSAPVKLVGLVSSYMEGGLLESAVASLAAFDHVVVFEGPVEGAPPSDVGSTLKIGPRVSVRHGEWESDAAKRTAMVEWVKSRRWLDGETWGLWLDGDELLLWGEYVRDWLGRAVESGDDGNAAAGYPIPLVELDGSVSICMGKLVRVDLIERYIVSSSFLELVGGRQVGAGNQDVWNPVDGPTFFTNAAGVVDGSRELPHWRARPPLQGEPHLLHRSALRSKRRRAERQSAAEERNFRGVDLPIGGS
jgi:hypothetical protein